MDPESVDKRFYEKKWMSIGNWNKERAPYLKKSAGIEGLIALKWAKEVLKNGKVLDLGCGAGRNSVLFAKNGFKVRGVDFSSKAIKLANLLKAENKSFAKFSVQSALELDLPNNSFDLVLDFGCFHHFRKNQWHKYLKNVLKVLKEKSYYLLYCFSKESGITGNYDKIKDYSYRNHHYNHYFSLEEINSFFSKNFKIIKKSVIKQKTRVLAFNIILMQRL